MSAILSAGPSSLILSVNTPMDTDGVTPRDDLIGLKVWYSTSANFDPATGGGTLAYNGTGLTTTISELTPGTAYYVKYALISEIEPDNYTVSSALTTTPTSATSQIVDISGFTSFVKSDESTFTPTTATLTAIVAGITNPVYAWTITGATPTTGTGSSITITPNANNGTGVGVTLSVTGTGLTTPITKTITIPITYVPPTYYISNYGAVFRRDLDGIIYPAAGIVLDSGYSKFKSSPAPTFVWKKDNVVISGATSYSYTVPASDYTSSTSHTYTSIVTGKDLGGNDATITATVQIPRIDDGPIGPSTPSFTISNYGAVFRKDISGTVYPSAGISLETSTAAFKSSPTVTYQWKKDDVVISGATSSSYTVPVSDYASVTTHKYSCTATGQSTTGVATTLTASVVLPRIDDGTGSTGPRVATGYVYYNTAQATAPTKPTATGYNYTTGQFTGLTTGWSTSVNANTPVAGTSVWACSFSVLEATYQSVTAPTITISDPFTFQNFTGLVTFTNMNTAFANNVTTIDGGKITTNSIDATKLTASYIQVGGAAGDVNSGITTISGGKITANSIDATKLTASYIQVGTAATDINNNTTTINGGKITTGSISTDKLAASFIQVGGAASDINTGTTTISGGKITANSISADKLTTSFIQVGNAASDINNNITTINGGKITTGSIDAARLTIGNTTSSDRIRLYDNKIEVWASGVRRVVLGDLA